MGDFSLFYEVYNERKVIYSHIHMATNLPKDGKRIGAVKKRDQVWNPKLKRWTKRDDKKRFLDQMKKKRALFKGVKKTI